MRGFLASTIAASIGVSCAAALVLPLAPPATAAPTSPASPPGARSARPATLPSAPDAAVPGSTQSLALVPVARDRTLGPVAAEQGLTRDDVRHFALVGVVWDDADTPLHGRVQVRTRSTRDGAWSRWRDLETHNDDVADPGAAERASGRVRGSTAPLWVGDSDGVDVRVRAESRHRRGGTARGTRAGTAEGPLPSGLRLELVDPGDPPPDRAQGPGATEIPALTKAATEDELRTLSDVELTPRQRANPYIGPRPRIITRRGWGADETLRARGFVYTKKVKAAFVHHTASGNGYTCSQAASVIRGIYRYHVRSMGWRDIGYNFLVDKCGTIYEGRAGGVAKPVLGAHTLGFNSNSMGIAVLGSFGSAKPPTAVLDAIARLTAWKLGLYGANPRGKTYLTSGGGNLYRKGKNVRLNVISGHRDGFATECPGRRLYGKLGTARSTAARYQGR